MRILKFHNVFFINGTAYAGKSTMVKLLAEKYNGFACEENYHDSILPGLASRSVEETLALVEREFGLQKGG